MFRMHTQPMKPFSNKIKCGSRHSLRGRGSTNSRENLTRKNKKRKQQQQQQTRTDREGRLFRHLVHMVHVQRFSLEKGRKGRRHDLCVIVSPYIHKHIFNRIVFDFSKCVDDGGGVPLRLQWCNFGQHKSENALS